MTATLGTVLVVEDDESLRRILGHYLRGHGIGAAEAASAEDAAQILEDGLRPELIVLDINLPGDNGWDLLRGSAFANAGRPPVVIASALPVSPKRLAEFGIAGYLPKPFPVETLVATIERLLNPGKDAEDS
ncbi:MAG: response regulator transcription factor [Chloroflexi bacterium]|nr:response regulator transcription factor [Chloroflexota bacterium]